jgi:tape measure domain-containing protein
MLGIVQVDESPAMRALQNIDSQGKKVSNTLGSVGKSALTIASGMGIYKSFESIVGGVYNTMIGFNSQMQTSEIGFTTMLGSADKATDMLKELRDFASKTPFEFPELLSATTKMKAMGFEAEEVLPTLKALGDASAGLGGTGETITRLTLALGQMKAKGKVSGEEMRQLAEVGIPAWEILAQAIGKTTAETMALSKKGVIPADKAVQALVKGIGERFPDMMGKLENSWAGVTSTIKDNTRFIIGDITKNLFGEILGGLMKVRDVSASMFASFEKGGLEQIYKDLIPVGIQEKITPLFDYIKEGFTSIKSTVTTVTPLVVDFFSTMFTVMSPIVPLTLSVIQGIQSFAEIISNNWSFVKPIVVGLFTSLMMFKLVIPVMGGLTLATQLLSGQLGLLAMGRGIVTGLSVAFLELATAPTILMGVTGALKALNLAWLATPWGIAIAGATALIGLFIGIKTHANDVTKKTEAMNEVMMETNKIRKEGIDQANLDGSQKQLEQLRALTYAYEKNNKAVEDAKKQTTLATNSKKSMTMIGAEEVKSLKKTTSALEELGFTYDMAKSRVEALEGAMGKASKEQAMYDVDALKTQKEMVTSLIDTNEERQNNIKSFTELSAKTKRNTDENIALQKAMDFLGDSFEKNITIRDKEGKIIGLNTQLLATEMKGYINSANTLKTSFEAKHQSRINDVKSEISRVQSIVDASQVELKALWEVQSAYSNADDGIGGRARAILATKIAGTVSNSVGELEKLKGLLGDLNKVKWTSVDSNIKNAPSIQLTEPVKKEKASSGKTEAEKKADEIKEMWRTTATDIQQIISAIGADATNQTPESIIQLKSELNQVLALAKSLGATSLMKSITESLDMVDSAINDTTGASATKMLNHVKNVSVSVNKNVSDSLGDLARNTQTSFDLSKIAISNSVQDINDKVKVENEKSAEELQTLWKATGEKINNALSSVGETSATGTKFNVLSLRSTLEDLKSVAQNIADKGLGEDLLDAVKNAISLSESVVMDKTGKKGLEVLDVLSTASTKVTSKLTSDMSRTAMELDALFESVKNSIIDNTSITTQNSMDNVNALYDNFKKAYENKINSEEKAETKSLNDMIKREQEKLQITKDRINDETNALVKAKQAQLDLLDEKTQGEDREAEKSKAITKIKELEVKLSETASLKDRFAVQQDIATATRDYQRMLLGYETADRKLAINKDITNLQDKAKLEITIAEKVSENNIKVWGERVDYLKDVYYPSLRTQAVQDAEFQRLISYTSQAELLTLLQTFGDGWGMLGKTYGQRMKEGFTPLLTEIQNMIAQALASLQALNANYGFGSGASFNPTPTPTLNGSQQSQWTNSSQYQSLEQRFQEASASGNVDLFNGLQNEATNTLINMFGGAPKYHSGGIVTKSGNLGMLNEIFSLKSNEVPTILEEGEVVISKGIASKLKNLSSRMLNLDPTNALATEGGFTTTNTYNIDVSGNSFKDGSDLGNRLVSTFKRYGL